MNKLSCILLVDDDNITNFANQMLIEDMEITEQVLVAFNGLEAIELIKKQCEVDCCPELILLDINMPVMNGFEFLETYKELEFVHKQSVVILMLTTSLNPKDVEQMKEEPIKGFLTKPLTEIMIRDLLRKHFNRDLS
ncbi:response regulator [Rhodocytophaga rosea]|uniref:Response regulator n=1 Tax=Rhodocytophaga rosea TaxID=2704465 RepID=A0A6C0GES7_9BACT|nr:response regulator [Rhodocytophaga rosea]QHT66252.1 response regulator [Rhodocytophaga rosea]